METRTILDTTHKQDQALHSLGVKYSTSLIADHFDYNGQLIKSYDLGSGLVTDAGVAFMSASFTGATAINAFNYHGSGIDGTAATTGDTTVSLSAGIPARSVGVQTCPASGTYRTVGLQTYTANTAIQEWGLFSALNAGTMWDRKTFAVINVGNGDSISFTYNLTCQSGG